MTVGVTPAFVDVGSGDAVGGGEGDEVGREDGRAGVVLVVEGLLPLADHAEEAVVDDGDVDGDPSCWMVESSAAVIWKPPSPAMTQTSFSGQAALAPMAAGSAKPMVPRPPEVMRERRASWR